MVEISNVSNGMLIILTFCMIICVFWPKQPEGWTAKRWKIFLAILALSMAFQLVRVCVSEYIEEPWIDKMIVFGILCRIFEHCASLYGDKMRKEAKKTKML